MRAFSSVVCFCLSFVGVFLVCCCRRLLLLFLSCVVLLLRVLERLLDLLDGDLDGFL